MNEKNYQLPFSLKKVQTEFNLSEASYYGMSNFEDNYAFANGDSIVIIKGTKKVANIQQAKVSRVTYYHNGDFIIALIDYYGVSIFETKEFQQVYTFDANLNGNNWSCAITDDEKYYIFSGNSGRVLILDLEKSEIVFNKEIHKSRVMGLSIKGYDLLTSSYDGNVCRIDLYQMNILDTFNYSEEVSSVLHFDNESFYLGLGNKLVKSDFNGQILESYDILNNAWCIQKLGPDHLIFVSWNNKSFKIFDLKKNQIIYTFYSETSVWELYKNKKKIFICTDIRDSKNFIEFDYKLFVSNFILIGERISKLNNVHFSYK